MTLARRFAHAMISTTDGQAERNMGMVHIQETKVLGICGSLRQASFNRAALRTAIGR
jgi:hypothetical protein